MRQIKINGFHLKMIAVCSMFIDHFACIIVERMANQPMSFWSGWDTDKIWTVYEIMRIIGRMAFPLYCYLLIEGFHHTKNRSRYARRLALFAVLSEVPFDLAFNYSVIEFTYNNVFFTLLLGFLVIWGFEFLSKQFLQKEKKNYVLAGILGLLGLAAALWVAELIGCDYGATGVLSIALMDLGYRTHHENIGFVVAVLSLAVLSSSIELFALLMLIPLYFYDHTRGKQRKYFFYFFYPGHLLVLDLIVLAMGMMLTY